MWRHALLGTVSLVAASNGVPNHAKNANSLVPVGSSLAYQSYAVVNEDPSATILSTGRSSLHSGPSIQSSDEGSSTRSSIDGPSVQSSGSAVPDPAPTSDVTTVTVIQVETPSDAEFVYMTLSPYIPSDSDSTVSVANIEDSSLTRTTDQLITIPGVITYKPSQAPYPYGNVTKTTDDKIPTTTSISRGQCTGCGLAAVNPMTTSYQSEIFGDWTSFVVTETILTEFVTYIDNSTIDTIVTKTKTVNQTKTVNGYITDTAAEFNIYLPSARTYLTLDVGPTYVIYTNLFGGPDAQVTATAPNNATQSDLVPSQSTCQPHVQSLRGWAPSRISDWHSFIQTFANGSFPEATAIYGPVPVPTEVQTFLAQDPDLQVYFQGANIATCTLADLSPELIADPSRTVGVPALPSAPAEISVSLPATQAPATSMSPPMFTHPGRNTFLQTTYASTSKHITKQGCLRCDTDAGDRPQHIPKPTDQGPDPDKIHDNPAPTNSPEPKTNNPPQPNDKPSPDSNPPNYGRPQSQPQNVPQNPSNPDVTTSPSVPDFISSVVSDNPDLTRRPQDQPTDSGQIITIGSSAVTVKPPPQAEQSQGGPNQQVNTPTMVIIGTQTVRVGQTTTINGVAVVVPTAGGGSTLVIGDKTIELNPGSIQVPMPVLTYGHDTITANPQGQFVVGTQTLLPGGPIVVVDDYSLIQGPNGKVAIWNGATQTLVTMYGQPAVTFGGQEVTAKLIHGTTVFVLGDKTLGPGNAVTVDGTTFSLPARFHGSSIVVNGQTQRLGAGLPALTAGNSLIKATVVDGTTQFVLAPGQTLTPGGVLIFGGTTYSLPVDGQASTVVVNGVTSRLNPLHLPVLPFGGGDVTANIAQGTTAFIFGPGQTLTPGGIVIVSGTTFSLPASASGSVVVINGVTSTIGMGPTTSAPPIVVDGQIITATTLDGTIEYVLNSATTLFPGGEVVIDGTTYSLAPGGTAVIVNGKTSVLSSTPASNTASTTTIERGAGDFIASGIGESKSSSRGAGSLAHGGGADKWVESLMMGVAGWLLWLV